MNQTTKIQLKKENPRVDIRNLTIMAILLSVLLAIASFVYTPYVLLMGLVALITGAGLEYVFTKVRKRPYKLDAGAFITPLIFVLLMPPQLPLYMVFIGTFFGVFFGKMIFGGNGRNIFNPAITAYLFLLVTFPFDVGASFIDPITGSIVDNINLADATFTGTTEQLFGLLLGQYANSIGATFVLGVWIVGAILLFLKVADWRIPLTILISTAIFTAIFGNFYPGQFSNAFVALFQGQLMFVAFFVATDPVTAPRTSKARIYYAIGIALITVIIRGLANAPEGIVYAVIIMNAVGPMFEPLEVIQEEESK
jgi:Na+-translocating ferredoxin:NAD+ oxidoreductase RnfD subunit